MLLSLGVLFTLRFFGLGETKPAIVTELRPQYRLIYVAPDPEPVPTHSAYHHYIGPPPESLLRPAPQTSASDHYPRPVLSSGEGVGDDDVSGNDVGYEVSQFHTEDEHGKVVHGFRSHDQARMEARDADGTVRGMYSYVDALGNVVKMHYWDDGHGMHMAGNNLPIAMYQMPEFTPEVRAARDEHFRLYEAALTALKAAGLEVEGHELEEENEDEHFIVPPVGSSDFHDPEGIPIRIPSVRPPPSSSSASSDEEDDFDHLVHEPVIIENESIEKEPVNSDDEEEEYPKYEYTPLQATNHAQHEDNEDKESVAIENPEFRAPPQRQRQGKSSELSSAETKDTSSQALSSENAPQSHGQHESRESHDDPSSSLTKEQPIVVPDAGKSFYYHFTHVIPKPVERVDDASLKSSETLISQRQQLQQDDSRQYPVYQAQAA